MQRYILLVVVGLLVAGCAGQQNEAAPQAATDIQEYHVTAGPSGFEPQSIELQAGVPARLFFTRTADSRCQDAVQIPDFNIERTDLPLNVPVAIEFTPGNEGTYTFACGMNMLRGSILVRS